MGCGNSSSLNPDEREELSPPARQQSPHESPVLVKTAEEWEAEQAVRGIRRAPTAQICFEQDVSFAEEEKQGLTVHLKGFGARIEYNDRATSEMALNLLKWLKELAPARLVWDGDSHSHDSFTALIPQIYRENDQMQLIAFLREYAIHSPFSNAAGFDSTGAGATEIGSRIRGGPWASP